MDLKTFKAKLRPGARVSASGMDSLIDEVLRLKGEVITLRQRVARKEARLVTRRTVLIVVDPVEGATTVSCRAVRYKTIPPQPCEEQTCFYEFSGPPFDAYPWFGAALDDYDVHGTGTIDKDAPFYEAYYEEDTWRLQKPAEGGGGASGLSECVIIAIDGTKALRIQEIDNDNSGNFIAKGSVRSVPTFGGWSSELWRDFIRFNTINAQDMVAQPLWRYSDGRERVGFKVPFQPQQPNQSNISGGCSVT